MSYDGGNGGQEGYQYGYPVQSAYGHPYLSGEFFFFWKLLANNSKKSAMLYRKAVSFFNLNQL